MDACRSVLSETEAVQAPLGIYKVSAGISKYCVGVETHVLNWGGLDLENAERTFVAFLKGFRPAIVGISTFSVFMPNAVRIARLVRDFDPRVPIVVGGSHVTANPEGVTQYDVFDYYVVGDGEKTGPMLFNALLDGSPPLDEIPGISFRRGAGLVRTRSQEYSYDMDEIPSIDWGSLLLDSYIENRTNTFGSVLLTSEKGQFLPYIASRGCTYRCAFCERTDGAKHRVHSPKRVVSDVRALQEAFESRFVFLLDDNIHLNPEWFDELLDELKKEFKTTTFACFVMGDRLSRTQIDRLYEAGFRLLACFPETASERLRQSMNKNIRLDRLLTNMRYASELGMLIQANFLLGWPGETAEEAEQTLRLAEEDVFDFVAFCALQFLSGADMYQYVARMGIKPDTSEFFEQLANTPLFTEYGRREYHEYLDRGNALNMRKIQGARLRTKLAEQGLRVRTRPFDPVSNRDVGKPPLGLNRSPCRGGDAGDTPSRPPSERSDANDAAGPSGPDAPTRHEYEELLAYLQRKWGAPGFNILDAEVIAQPPGFQLVIDDGRECLLRMNISRKDSGPCLIKTALFDLGFSGQTLSGEQRALFANVTSQIKRWERQRTEGQQIPGSPALLENLCVGPGTASSER